MDGRGQRQIIDYVILNKKNTRVFRSTEIGTDHLLISEFKLPSRWKKNSSNNNNNEEVYKVHLLQEYSIRHLYQKRRT